MTAKIYKHCVVLQSACSKDGEEKVRTFREMFQNIDH